jgi:hypothetical protein
VRAVKFTTEWRETMKRKMTYRLLRMRMTLRKLRISHLKSKISRLQREQLRRMEQKLNREEPKLAAMMDMFGRLSQGEKITHEILWSK